MSEVTAGQRGSGPTPEERKGGREEGREERKYTSNTTRMHFSAERCCVLPVPLDNNAAVVVTVAESKRGETEGREEKSTLEINTAPD